MSFRNVSSRLYQSIGDFDGAIQLIPERFKSDPESGAGAFQVRAQRFILQFEISSASLESFLMIAASSRTPLEEAPSSAYWRLDFLRPASLRPDLSRANALNEGERAETATSASTYRHRHR